MKLILRADVDHLGRLGDVVDVKPGYGRNYLVPKGLAMAATESNRKVFEQESAKLQKKMDALRAEAMSLGEKIQTASLEIPMRVGEGDKLYGSVTNAIIAELLEEAIGEKIDRRKIVLEDPIRALGQFTVPVKLHQDVQVELEVKVMRHDAHLYEEEEQAAAEAASEASATSEDAEPEASTPSETSDQTAASGEAEAPVQ